MTPVNVEPAERTNFCVVTSVLSHSSRRLSSGAPLTAASILAVFAAARRLQADAHTGRLGKPLRGMNLALLLDRSTDAETNPLRLAALEFGARVAEVRFTEPAGASAANEIRSLGRMLGRMYDAIDCGALAQATVRGIEQEAGVPVYDGLALDDHPARVLADLMTLDDRRPPSASASGSSILYLGDPRTPRGRTFLSAARAIGFGVCLADPAQAAPDDATFVVDARQHPHWLLHAPSGPFDEARRSETHRRVMQAVLLDSLVAA